MRAASRAWMQGVFIRSMGAARTSKIAARGVPTGSSGDCIAIVTQFMMMTNRMNGSNARDSTK